MKLRGFEVSLADVKEFWDTNDKVTKDYLVCVNAELYRKVRQLKPK